MISCQSLERWTCLKKFGWQVANWMWTVLRLSHPALLLARTFWYGKGWCLIIETEWWDFFSWWDWAGKICWLNEYSILLVDLIILQYFLSFETTLSTSSVIFLAIPSPCNHLAAPWLISSPRWYKKFTARLLEHHCSAWIHIHCWLREDINRKKTFSFRYCPNHLPPRPPPWPQFGQLGPLFSEVEIQDLKVSLKLKTLYILYNILYICNLKNS